MSDTPVTAVNAGAFAFVSQSPAAAPGFAGQGHTAIKVIAADHLAQTDPFVLLMDGTLDFYVGQPVGDAHPHAGLETVTLVIEGALDDPQEGLMKAGDAVWMTAGRGIVHNENVRALGRTRNLQLWVALSSIERGRAPDIQLLPLADIPVRREPGAEARIYSGRSGVLASTTRNRTPMTVVDFLMKPGASITQALPGSYRGFMYVIEGGARVGDHELAVGAVGWIEPSDVDQAAFTVRAGSSGAHVILFAGEPLRETILQHGPFVGGSEAELASMFKTYRSGKLFPRVIDVLARKRADAGVQQ